MNTENTYLQALIDAGDDAHKNLYEVIFTPNAKSPLKTSNVDMNALTVRCSGFTAPTVSQDSYPVKFVTATIERPKAKLNHERSFTVTFRLDANYQVYTNLLQQQKVTFNATSHVASNEVLAAYAREELFTTTVKVIGEAQSSKLDTVINTVETIYEYEGCWISKIDTVSFSSGGSDAATVQVTINYLKAKDNFNTRKVGE